MSITEIMKELEHEIDYNQSRLNDVNVRLYRHRDKPVTSTLRMKAQSMVNMYKAQLKATQVAIDALNKGYFRND